MVTKREIPSPFITPGGKQPIAICQRLVGTVVDTQNRGMPNVSLRIGNNYLLGEGPKTKSAQNGWFLLKEVAARERDILLSSPQSKSETRVSLFLHSSTTLNIVYDTRKSRCGALSIFAYDATEYDAPLKGGYWETSIDGECIGLEAMLGPFNVWLLWKHKNDSVYRVQHTAASVDAKLHRWTVNLRMGDMHHPPKGKDVWDVVAVAASRQSKMKQLKQVRDLRTLPPHFRTIPASIRVRPVR